MAKVSDAYLNELNVQQRAAVEYSGGASLVIAGAGSGKTRVLTYKIVHLLRGGMEPYRILALTFTNKAANEMRERIEKLVGEKTASKLWMGTFHSIFLRILRQNADKLGFKSSFTIYDAADSKSLIKSIIKDMDLDDKVYKPSTVQNAISMAKNALISPEQYAADRDLMEADRRARRPLMHEVYRAYRTRCFVAGAMDFDDLLYYTNVLLRDYADVRTHYQEFFKYILVDEYQDTNFAQHLIISRLTERNHNFCVVGDDAQSIYSFRGANIRNILNLKNTYPDLKLFKLEQNYRSTQMIVEAANSLIDKNRDQIKKNVFSKNERGGEIEVVKCMSDYDEASVVVNRIRELRRQTGNSLAEFAVLYRTNAQSRTLEEQLRKANLNYVIYGGLSFYQRKEIKDALAYFRLSVNPDDDEALKRVINIPARGIGETTIKKLQRAAMDNEVSMWSVLTDPLRFADVVQKGTWKKLDVFTNLVSGFVDYVADTSKTAADAAMEIIGKTGLLTQFDSERTPENITRRENIEELIKGVNEFVDLSQQEDGGERVSMTDYLGSVSLATDQDVDVSDNGEHVTLMTAHAAKGLEFNNIFIVGVEDDLFPSAMSKDNVMQIEEERRLLYVAITRAKRFCMMSYAQNRFRNGQTTSTRVSPFLYDIDRRYLNFVAGSEIGSRRGFNPTARYMESFHSPTRQMADSSKYNLGTTAPQTSPKTEKRVYFSNTQGGKQSASMQNGEYGYHKVDELNEGSVIEHQTFGRGRIVTIDDASPDARIVVSFENTSQRTLLLKFARFKIINK